MRDHEHSFEHALSFDAEAVKPPSALLQRNAGDDFTLELIPSGAQNTGLQVQLPKVLGLLSFNQPAQVK